jgi:poly(A) polymerase
VNIGQLADAEHIQAYVVGGYVRDKILGKDVTDIDIMVVGDGIGFARIVAEHLKKTKVVTYESFGTAMLPLDDGKIEFVSAREEFYDPASRKPQTRHATVESDLSRRDFTINALAASINHEQFGEILDPFQGHEDLQRGIIRTPLAPDRTFDDDPLRMLRAVRFSAQLFDEKRGRRFFIEEETLQAIKNKSSRLSIVSKERITDEFLKILSAPQPSIGLKLLYETGLAAEFLPELVDMVGVEQRKDYHHKDVFLHTLKVVDNISTATDDVWLRFVALMHDVAKPRTKAFKEGIGWTFHGHEDIGARMMKPIFRRMRLPMDKLPYVEKLIRLHLRPMVLVSEEVTDSAIRRTLFEAGADIDDLMLLCRADITSQNPERVARYLKNYDIVMKKMEEVEKKDRLRNWQPPIRGNEIMEVCGIPPSPLVGILKSKIEDAILEGVIPNEHDAALEYLLSIKGDILSENSPNSSPLNV